MSGALCSARTRNGTRCRNRAGKGTNHLGQGRCKFHGGATPIKHGAYSKLRAWRVKDLLLEIESRDENPSDLREELALLRAVAAGLVETAGEGYHLHVSRILGQVGKLAEINHQNQQSISIPVFRKIFSRVGQIVAQHIPEGELPEVERKLLSVMVEEFSSNS